jgi:hypothetical protein
MGKERKEKNSGRKESRQKVEASNRTINPCKLEVGSPSCPSSPAVLLERGTLGKGHVSEWRDPVCTSKRALGLKVSMWGVSMSFLEFWATVVPADSAGAYSGASPNLNSLEASSAGHWNSSSPECFSLPKSGHRITLSLHSSPTLALLHLTQKRHLANWSQSLLRKARPSLRPQSRVMRLGDGASTGM